VPSASVLDFDHIPLYIKNLPLVGSLLMLLVFLYFILILKRKSFILAVNNSLIVSDIHVGLRRVLFLLVKWSSFFSHK